MNPKPFHELGELQRDVLEELWRSGESSVRDLQSKLERDTPPAYTTVLSVLQKLEKAGWVRHRSEGRSYLYSPARSREDAGGHSLRKLIDRTFRGDPLRVFQTLLAEDRLGEAELDELQRMIEAKRRDRDDR